MRLLHTVIIIYKNIITGMYINLKCLIDFHSAIYSININVIHRLTNQMLYTRFIPALFKLTRTYVSFGIHECYKCSNVNFVQKY